MNGGSQRPVLSGWRFRCHEIIFEADTKAGNAFDVTLIITILLSVLAVMLDSVELINARYGRELYLIIVIPTGIFAVEISQAMKDTISMQSSVNFVERNCKGDRNGKSCL